MNNYEAMFIIDAKSDEKSANAIFDQIKEAITKNNGSITSSRIWLEKVKLNFTIRKKKEATYFLVLFKSEPALIDKIKPIYRLNENILRVLITKQQARSKGE